MISKSELLECSITNFTKFGSKSFTLDELASELGVSKKTIYNYFKNKEDLVSSSLTFLLDKIVKQIDSELEILEDPIDKIIKIYELGFSYFDSFKPSFLFGIKKYYPKADDVFEAFRNDIVFNKVYNLLQEAQEKQYIRNNVNLKLVCELYFLRIESIIYKPSNFFEIYSKSELLKHLVIHNLQGILTSNYSNTFFE